MIFSFVLAFILLLFPVAIVIGMLFANHFESK